MTRTSREECDLFILPPGLGPDIASSTAISMVLAPLNRLGPRQLFGMVRLYGTLRFLYLVFRYGSAHTYLQMANDCTKLIHCLWLVPSEKISAKYPFVIDGSYAIIAGITDKQYRGQGIFPRALCAIRSSDLSRCAFWVWTEQNNASSRKGILKAGGVRTGMCTHEKSYWGLRSSVRYVLEADHAQKD